MNDLEKSQKICKERGIKDKNKLQTCIEKVNQKLKLKRKLNKNKSTDSIIDFLNQEV